MLATYILIFLLGCGVGMAVNDFMHRRRQRRLAHQLLQALDSGQFKRRPARGRAVALDDHADDPGS